MSRQPQGAHRPSNLYCLLPYGRPWQGWSWEAFSMWGPYLRISVATTLMVALDWCAKRSCCEGQSFCKVDAPPVCWYTCLRTSVCSP